MRIFLTYNHEMLHSKTERISLPFVISTDDLLAEIKKRVTLQEMFNVKFNIDGQTVKVIPGWALTHYGIKQGSSLHLEFIQSKSDSVLVPLKSIETYALQPPGGLGNLQKIEQEGQQQEQMRGRASSILDSFAVTQSQQNQKMDNYLYKLLKAAKKGDLQEVKYILQNNKDLLNQFGESGWTLIHYVAFYNHIKILQYLISLHASLNLVTTEGWTALQLAIKRNNLDVFKKLITTKGINLNEVTEKGTALHLAVELNQQQFVKILIDNKVDDSLKDKLNRSALDICQNLEIKAILTASKKQNSEQVVEQKQSPATDVVFVHKGLVYRQRFLTHIIKQIYLVCNPVQGTLVKYQKKQDYPKKPKQVIPLTEVTDVEMLNKVKKGHSYFEIIHSEKLVLSTKTNSAAIQWVKAIFDAANYSHKVQNEYKIKTNSIQIIEILDGEVLKKDSDIVYKKQSGFKKEKALNKIQAPKLSLRKTQSVFDSLTSDSSPQKSNPYIKAQSLTPESKSNFDSSILLKNQQQGQKSAKQIQHFDDNQKEKSDSGDSSNHSSFASNGKKQNFSTMAEQPRIGIASFDIIKQVGSGSFGKVFLAKLRRTKQMFALKALKKSSLILKKQLKYAIGEANILKKMFSPFILQLHYAFQTPHYLYLCLDYCPHGDLSEYLMKQQQGILEQDEAKNIISQLILAVEHMHCQNVIYRDMKPQNVLIGADGFIRLADFGLSKGDVANNVCASFCGSPAYLSPQMLKQKGVGKQSDVYGLGCILYEMLVGQPPYYDDDMQVLYQNIQKGNLKFTGRISNQAKQIIQKLLQRDPVKRITIQKMKKHTFFCDVDFQALSKKQVGRLNVEKMEMDDESDDEDVQLSDTKKPAFIDADYTQDKKFNKVNNFSFTRSAS